MANGKFIAYYRVSTERQGQSGLGLEAQRKAVADYLNGGQWELVAEFTEVESGKNSDRKELIEALALCRKHKATLIIAKLDRLSRNVAFVANLMEGSVEFVACDFPTANRLTLHIMAAVAQHEREQNSARTIAALKAAKARGRKLGWANPARQAEQRKAAALGRESSRKKADQFAERVMHIIRELQAQGITSLYGLAKALNAKSIKTARGGAWYPVTVDNLLSRK